jgi:hypothetical protein
MISGDMAMKMSEKALPVKKNIAAPRSNGLSSMRNGSRGGVTGSGISGSVNEAPR